jgi:hypothetical protein
MIQPVHLLHLPIASFASLAQVPGRLSGVEAGDFSAYLELAALIFDETVKPPGAFQAFRVSRRSEVSGHAVRRKACA